MIRRRLNALRRDGLSTQVYLVALAIALIGPGLLFTAVLLGRYAALERIRFEQDARESVRGIALSIDRDMAGLVSVLQTLAASPRPQREDFGEGGLDGFERQARAVKETTGLDLSLRRADGTQLVNTALPPGAPLPQDPRAEDAEVLATQRPVIGGVRAGGGGRPPTYDVAVPVMAEGAPLYVLSVTVPVARLHQILVHDLAPGWTTGIIDRNGLLLARSEDHASLAGQPMQASLRSHPSAAADIWEGIDRRRRPVLYVETTVKGTGWTVGASIPKQRVEAPLRRWVLAFGGFGLLALAVSSVLAVRLWARVAEPLRQLAGAGGALAAGQPVPRVSSPIREIRQLADALADASQSLRRRIAERDQALDQQSRSLAALRESEARFRHMADSAPALIWMTDAEGEVVFVNLHYGYLFGRSTETLAGGRWREIIHPDDLPGFEAAFAAAFAERRPFRYETRVTDKHGATRWILCEGVARLDDHGRFLGYTGCNVDITEAKAAEAALREGEERLRLALAAGRLGTWEIDLASGQHRLSARSAEIFGAAPLSREAWTRTVHPEDRARIEAALADLLAGVAEYRTEFRIRPDAASPRWAGARWVSAQAIVQRDAGGRSRRVIGIHQEVTERKRAEEHLRLLVHELNHRVKNTLATVQSIAMQSLRGLGGPAVEGARIDAAKAAFEARLIALARVHDVLTRESWEGAELAEVVKDALAPLDGPGVAPPDGRGTPPRFVVDGPPVRLPPRIALSIAMALHELATNAVKYGALSVPSGQVALSWNVAEGRLSLRWQERGGPPVVPPSRTGFGSRLIERSLARELDGTVSLTFPPEGVVCTIVAPLDEAPADAPEAGPPEIADGRPGRDGRRAAGSA
ncbi:sensor histidine kinase [Methylobacterium nonmethylotrophicum]|uniref:Blue-light-activated histidine kinase n=1 Tax=Methylobacterium nonmethylotrophicum TaxID=1141884 RepID=A0A4Z0NNM8_9HYPH|nr:sensor histidine kinase [Methylobacterium nonmethylotrophicum]TGD97220.1 PAS domain S-box protein [Methylobacterium nonmethylotrophicum]